METSSSVRREIIEIEDDSEDENDKTELYVNLEEDGDESETPPVYDDEHAVCASLIAFERLQDNAEPILPTADPIFYSVCLDKVVEFFPDISRDHVRQLYDAKTNEPVEVQQQSLATNYGISQEIVMMILDGRKYPKEQERKKNLKRKQSDLSDDKEKAEWTAPGRLQLPWHGYTEQAYVCNAA